MWLSWKLALMFAGAGVPATSWLRRSSRRWTTAITPVVREAAVVFALYGAWRLLGEITLMSTAGARQRGLQIWHAERWLHLPNELTMQRWALHSTALIRFANAYYIVAHVAPLGIAIVWFFFRDRERYRRWRNLLAFSSLACLAIQLIPVAPPRLYPELGFVDTGARYGPRVYDTITAHDVGQLAAMPSMHVAWALLIAMATWQVARTRRWRWLGPAHALGTIFAVTVTAYHWLADGIVAALIVALGVLAARMWRRARAGRASRRAGLRSGDVRESVPAR